MLNYWLMPVAASLTETALDDVPPIDPADPQQVQERSQVVLDTFNWFMEQLQYGPPTPEITHAPAHGRPAAGTPPAAPEPYQEPEEPQQPPPPRPQPRPAPQRPQQPQKRPR